MGQPKEEGQRPYETLDGDGYHVHYDRRLDLYGLREQVVEEAGGLRRTTGTEHFEAIPHRWELDLNFSSIEIRGTEQDGVHQVFNFVREDGAIRLQAQPTEPVK